MKDGKINGGGGEGSAGKLDMRSTILGLKYLEETEFLEFVC